MPLLTQLQRIDVVYLLFNSWQCVFPLVSYFHNCILRADMRMRSEAIDSEHARIAIESAQLCRRNFSTAAFRARSAMEDQVFVDDNGSSDDEAALDGSLMLEDAHVFSTPDSAALTQEAVDHTPSSVPSSASASTEGSKKSRLLNLIGSVDLALWILILQHSVMICGKTLLEF